MIKAKKFLLLIALLFLALNFGSCGGGGEDGGGGGSGSSDCGQASDTCISGRALNNNAGLSGVTMSLSGYATATTTTDDSGNYSFRNLPTRSSSYTTYYLAPTKTGYTFYYGSRLVSQSYPLDITFGGAGGQAILVYFTAYGGGGGGNTITDIDGNIYNTVTIGTQVWIKENLKVTRYRNGETIPTTTADISGETTPKYQWAYNGNQSNVSVYGRLYTWYAVTDSRGVCPTGWHLQIIWEAKLWQAER